MTNDAKIKLETARLNILYSNIYQSLAVLTFFSLIVGYFYKGEYGYYNYKPLVYSLWFPASIIVYIFKALILILYRKKLFFTDNYRFWLFLFYFSVILTGSVTGSTILFVPEMHNETAVLIIILSIGAISSGAVSLLSTSFTSYIIYNSLAIIPYIFYFINSESADYRIIGYLIVFLSGTFFITAYRMNRTLEHSLSLKIENDLIIDKLSESEEKFAKSFYSGIAPMAMLSFSDAKFIDINNAMLNLIEYTREEIIGKNPYDFNLNENPAEFIDIVLETAEAGHIFNRETTLKTKSGLIKRCLATVEKFRLNNSIIAFIMLQDFTERFEYEKNLKIERDRAEEAAKAKATFLASMSHEIRTPMNSILGMTALAMMSEAESERKEYLSTVKDSAEYLLILINDILDFSKIEAGKIEIELIDYHLPGLIESVYRMMKLHADNKKLEFVIMTESSVPEYIKCSPERLKQILINLIGNAIKFTLHGSVKACIRLSDGANYHQESAGNEFIEFSVTDTGIGIPEDKHEEIFKSFTQAHSSTFRKFGGTGLGLSISRQLIWLMDGDIKVKSTPGEGSTFSFIIPLIHGNRPASEDTEEITGACSDVKKVLIAEDNVLNQKLISAYMKKLNHDYTLAENGNAVIELLKNNCFDVILMDLEMPELDGYETMKQIRSGAAGDNNKNIVIHAMSAHVMTDTVERCLAEGFNGYITKPVDLKKLTEVL